VLGRLFESLQHGVEGRVREHVHLVDHIDLETAARWRIDRILKELTHFIDLGIGRRVYLEQIHKAPAVDLLTCGTGAAGVAVIPVSQFKALARIRARVVFPTPRVPVNR
jgi:hypothetical protein